MATIQHQPKNIGAVKNPSKKAPKLSDLKRSPSPKEEPNVIIPGTKTVSQIENEREQEEIYNTLRNFKTLAEINRNFGSLSNEK